MKKYLSALALCLSALMPVAAQAAEGRYNFDNPHTQIMFSVSHVGYTQSHGRFLKYDGFFAFDPDHPETGRTEITIDTRSLSMGDEAWDKATLGKEFLDADHYPAITFKSTGVKKTGDKTGQLNGDLTLHGVTRPVTLDVTLNKAAVMPMLEMFTAGFSAHTVIKRSDFGMTEALSMIGDDVAIDIEVEGHRQDPQIQPK